MATTYTLIETIDLASGGQTSLDFQNIPSTYKELALHYYIRNTGANGGALVKFNGSSSSYYNLRAVGTYSSTTPTADNFGGFLFGIIAPSTAPTGYFGQGWLMISQYANASYDKNAWFDSVYEPNATTSGGGLTQCVGANWNNTATINRITITSEDAGANLAQYSYASLYGIA